GALPFEHLADHLRGDGLDVGPVRHLGVGHDGGGVGIDEHHLIALLPEGLAGLGPGIIELAGLADDDRPRADDQDFLQIGAFRHNLWVARQKTPGPSWPTAPGWSLKKILRRTRRRPAIASS